MPVLSVLYMFTDNFFVQNLFLILVNFRLICIVALTSCSAWGCSVGACASLWLSIFFSSSRGEAAPGLERKSTYQLPLCRFLYLSRLKEHWSKRYEQKLKGMYSTIGRGQIWGSRTPREIILTTFGRYAIFWITGVAGFLLFFWKFRSTFGRFFFFNIFCNSLHDAMNTTVCALQLGA